MDSTRFSCTVSLVSSSLVPPDDGHNYFAFLFEYHSQLPHQDLDQSQLQATAYGGVMRRRCVQLSHADAAAMLADTLAIPNHAADSFAPKICDFAASFAEDFPTVRLLALSVRVVERNDDRQYSESDSDSDDDVEQVLPESGNNPGFVPATEESISALPTISGKLSRECTVCMEELVSFEEEFVTLTSMPCFHVYHKNCIVNWLRISHVCPLCRYAMPTC